MHFSCSTRLSKKFSLLLDIEKLIIVGIFIFISKEMVMLSMYSKKEYAVVSNLRSISRTNMLSFLSFSFSFSTYCHTPSRTF